MLAAKAISLNATRLLCTLFMTCFHVCVDKIRCNSQAMCEVDSAPIKTSFGYRQYANSRLRRATLWLRSIILFPKLKHNYFFLERS